MIILKRDESFNKLPGTWFPYVAGNGTRAAVVRCYKCLSFGYISTVDQIIEIDGTIQRYVCAFCDASDCLRLEGWTPTQNSEVL